MSDHTEIIIKSLQKFTNDLFSLPLWLLEYLLINNNQFDKHLFIFVVVLCCYILISNIS